MDEKLIVRELREIKEILIGKKVVCKPEVKPELKNGRSIDWGDGTIQDIKTGLMWVKNPHTDLPEKFKGEMTWQDAKEACEELDFAGYDDWRLPTVEELRALVDYTKGGKSGEPAIDTSVFPDTKCSWYWTSTPTAWCAGSAWIVSFSYGSVGTNAKDSRGCVRPVRASK